MGIEKVPFEGQVNIDENDSLGLPLLVFAPELIFRPYRSSERRTVVQIGRLVLSLREWMKLKEVLK